jgi:hypothetical protein
MARNDSLDKVVEDAVWRAYKRYTRQNLKKLVKRLSREHDIDRDVISNYLQNRIKNSQKWWNRLKIGLATSVILGVLSAGSLFFYPKSDNPKVTAEDKPFYRKGPGNKIYLEEKHDLTGDKHVWFLLQKELKRDFRGNEKVEVPVFKGRHYVKPITEEFSLDKYIKILERVQAEFDYLGLDNNYDVKKFQTLDELSAETDLTGTLWLAKDVGLEVDARIKVTGNQGVRNGSVKFSVNYNGRALGETKLDKGKAHYDKKGTIFIKTKTKDRIDNHVSIYAEPLHHQLIGSTERLVNHLLKFEVDGNPQYPNFEDALSAVCVTDEAIVHGLNHNWLEENLDRLGLTQEDLQQEIDQKEKQFTFKGVKVIRRLASQMGRRELLQDYMKDPVKYWNILKAEIPEYKDILSDN